MYVCSACEMTSSLVLITILLLSAVKHMYTFSLYYLLSTCLVVWFLLIAHGLLAHKDEC